MTGITCDSGWRAERLHPVANCRWRSLAGPSLVHNPVNSADSCLMIWNRAINPGKVFDLNCLLSRQPLATWRWTNDAQSRFCSVRDLPGLSGPGLTGVRPSRSGGQR